MAITDFFLLLFIFKFNIDKNLEFPIIALNAISPGVSKQIYMNSKKQGLEKLPFFFGRGRNDIIIRLIDQFDSLKKRPVINHYCLEPQ